MSRDSYEHRFPLVRTHWFSPFVTHPICHTPQSSSPFAAPTFFFSPFINITRPSHLMQPNEKQAMQQMLERESKREKNLEARAKELRQKEKRASEMKAAEGAADLASWEEQLKTIEADFWRSVQTKEERAPASDFPIDDEACVNEES